MSNNFVNEDELQQLILIYRANIEHLRQNHDNLLSMMVVVLHHFGGEVKIPYSEIEELGQGTPYTIRMVPDEQQENMIITVEKLDTHGGDPDDETGVPEFSGGFDSSIGASGRTKLDA